MTRIGVLGTGDVGQVLAKGLKKHGYPVRIGSRTREKMAAFAAENGIETGTFDEVAEWADALVLAVKGLAAAEVLESCGRKNLAGKPILDTTNPIADEPPEDGVLRFFTGPNSSLMETLQTDFPEARFVKCFSLVGSDYMIDPQFPDGKPTMFYCGNDPGAKVEVAHLIEKVGWEPADMGTVKAARAIEPLAQLWCIPGIRENKWTHAFRLLRM